MRNTYLCFTFSFRLDLHCKLYLFLLSIGLMLTTSFAQDSTNVLSLDGIDDYAVLSPEVGNNVRTIEFWFKSNP